MNTSERIVRAYELMKVKTLSLRARVKISTGHRLIRDGEDCPSDQSTPVQKRIPRLRVTAKFVSWLVAFLHSI